MASISIPFSSQFTGTAISSSPSPPMRRSSVAFRRPFSVSASCATAERTNRVIVPSQSQNSLYEVLGVRSSATCQEIKTAYRRLARVLHPDVAESSAATAAEFIRLHAAYSTLSDPHKRASYDRKFFRPAPVAVSGNNCRRKWETDQCW